MAKRLLLSVSFLVVCHAGAIAETLCSSGEDSYFSCKIKGKEKIVSICGSKDLSKERGYLQYRFGVPGKIEFEYHDKDTRPGFRLTRSKDDHAEYNALDFTIGNYWYQLTSFRKFTDTNGQGFPTPASNDSLYVKDERSGMKGGFLFSGDCEEIGKPLNVQDIGDKTGLPVGKGGF